jgi:outer membrane murein-binding lipoprotein Lpp
MSPAPTPVRTGSVSLYELGVQWQQLEDVLVESGGEWTEEVEAYFAALGQLEGAKVDAYAHVVRGISAYADALKAEESALRDKRKAAEHAIERLKARLLDYMRERDVRELRGTTWKAAIQRNGGLRPMELLVAPEELPEAFQLRRVEPNWPAIRAAVGEGLPPPDLGATLTLPGAVGPDLNVLPVGLHLRLR